MYNPPTHSFARGSRCSCYSGLGYSGSSCDVHDPANWPIDEREEELADLRDQLVLAQAEAERVERSEAPDAACDVAWDTVYDLQDRILSLQMQIKRDPDNVGDGDW